MSDLLRDLARAKAVFQLRAIEAVIYAGAIADRNPSGGDVQQAPSRSDESGGAGTAIAQPQTPIAGTS